MSLGLRRKTTLDSRAQRINCFSGIRPDRAPIARRLIRLATGALDLAWRRPVSWFDDRMVDVVPGLPTVRYGNSALSDVMPSALAALGVPGEPNPLGLAETRRIAVLLVDGLGWTQLGRNRAAAPFLTSLPGRELTAGFPSTTVTSLASLGSGCPPGLHGLTGYTSYLADLGATISWLAWKAVGQSGTLLDQVVPEDAQPQPTAFERAEAAGITVTVAAPNDFGGTGLTRAALRGGRFHGTLSSGDVISRAAAASRDGVRSLVYCYVSESTGSSSSCGLRCRPTRCC
jgi:type I phosphodiesterase/nucleotide pyrophosphatase